MEWNILAAAFMRKERPILNLLRNYGEFRGSGYRDVVIGRVEDVHDFLEKIEILRRERAGKKALRGPAAYGCMSGANTIRHSVPATKW